MAASTPPNVGDVPSAMLCLASRWGTTGEKSYNSVKTLLLPHLRRVHACSTVQLDNSEVVSIYLRHHIMHGVEYDVLHTSAVGAAMCYLTHVAAWRSCVEHNKPLIVVEDDVHLTQKMAEEIEKAYATIPKGTDFASLLHLPITWSGDPDGPDGWVRVPSRRGFSGMQMYLITPRGAGVLLSTAFPMVTNVDTYVSYVATTLPDSEFRARVYSKRLYGWRAFFMDHLNSSIRHRPSLKKFMPESDIFYAGIIAAITVACGMAAAALCSTLLSFFSL
jgi:hypothetical protein